MTIKMLIRFFGHCALTGVLCLMLPSCSGNEDPAVPLTIDVLNPDHGPHTTLVSITGTGFSTKVTENKVSINGKTAVVKGASPTELVIEIPKSAGTGEVSVTVTGHTAVGPSFTYIFTPIVTTLAGHSGGGNADGMGEAARFYNPWGLTMDTQGMLYISDAANQTIRKITPAGVVTTFAGSTAGFANGTGSAAKFDQPTGITIDNSANLLVCDAQNKRIRKVTSAGVVSTYAGSGLSGLTDGEALTAKFSFVMGIAVDAEGNTFVSDAMDNRIRKITPAGIVSTFAGNNAGSVDGAGTQASFQFPTGITVDSKNNLYIADRDNHRIRKITPGAVVSTFAGSAAGFFDGAGTEAKFNYPSGLTIDDDDNIYVADYGNSAIRKITPNGIVTTLVADEELLVTPTGVVINGDETMYVTEYEAHRVRKITFE